MSVTAKFYCHSVQQSTTNPDVTEVQLRPVIGEGNESWSKWTPSGALNMSITNPDASKQFTEGATCFVTIDFEASATEAENAPETPSESEDSLAANVDESRGVMNEGTK